ncbi:MAG: ParA family protein [Blastochloris sp.]|nr:ParA family protein [Blastochloris sp.]
MPLHFMSSKKSSRSLAISMGTGADLPEVAHHVTIGINQAIEKDTIMAIIAVCMHKGGVGKTTTTLALGVEFATLGQRVLLVDLDPSADLTKSLGVDPTVLTTSIARCHVGHPPR